MIGWPQALWFVRHGESVGNVARARAYETGAEAMQLDCCDAEVALTSRGRDQAARLGRALAAIPAGEGPTSAVVSTYQRAQDTLDVALQAGGLDLPVQVDERFRDREQGILDLLTSTGIQARYPLEAERKALVGKFGYRPPGGESWADVALRLRAALLDLRVDHEGDRVLVVTHDVVVILTRLVLTGLSVQEALRLSGHVPNASLTSYRRGGEPRGMQLVGWADTGFLSG